jgi:hypothetical protein
VRHAALAAALLLAPGLAAAQSLCPGHVSASAAAAVPAGARIDLQLSNDGPTQLRVREVVRAALRERGFQVADRPDFVLAWRGRAALGGGTGFEIESRDMFRDSDDFGWLGASPSLTRRDPRPAPVMRLNAVLELREAASRRVVWTAVVSCERRGTDEQLARYLTQVLAPLIGRTVSGQAM